MGNKVDWINAKERLPEKDGLYLVVYRLWQFDPHVGIWDFDLDHENDWVRNDDYDEETEIMYWAELPEMPDELKK